MYHLRLFNEFNPNCLVISAVESALGKSCILNKTIIVNGIKEAISLITLLLFVREFRL